MSGGGKHNKSYRFARQERQPDEFGVSSAGARISLTPSETSDEEGALAAQAAAEKENILQPPIQFGEVENEVMAVEDRAEIVAFNSRHIPAPLAEG